MSIPYTLAYDASPFRKTPFSGFGEMLEVTPATRPCRRRAKGATIRRALRVEGQVSILFV